MSELESLEKKLDDKEAGRRTEAVLEIRKMISKGSLVLESRPGQFNLHAHSFFSYNGEGFSPSHLVWMTKKMGLDMIGLVDFDILDGVDELFEAAKNLGVAVIAGMETRAFVPEFATREINSPGEPGISYHMGSGFISSKLNDPSWKDFFISMRENPQRRNRDLVSKVNAFLDPVKLDYDQDILPLTPKGVATERHICQAYEEKSRKQFPKESDLVAFWSKALGAPESEMAKTAASPAKLQALIRSKTMKKGGVGYQQPDDKTFPRMDEVNRFILAQGAIPMMTWLDGTSAGESAAVELMDVEMKCGAAALNIIPDRNWNIANPEEKKKKAMKLEEIVRLADERGLPIQIGTEMNAPGLKRVDDFSAPELKPYIPSFMHGARILY
ncbi:MAG: hypothetical protein JNM63_15750, partial [Spirochaetia bacterium]|nr:hypothetical protein [Spirochaetia bacterium]